MKTLLKVGMIFILSVFTSSLTYAGVNQWTTNGPAGRSANALVIDPKNPATLYVGTDESMFKSTDSAESWLKLTLPFAVEVTGLTIDPTNPAILYANYRRMIPLPDGTTTFGVLKSSDGGVGWTDWTTVFTPLGGYTCDRVLAIAPTTPASSAYLRCSETASGSPRLFKSVDDGRSWMLLSLPQVGTLEKVVVDPVTPTTIYVPSFSGAFKSADSGETWINFAGPHLDTPTGIWDLAIAPTAPHALYARVYVSTSGYLFAPVGIYRSTDGGKTWDASPRVDPGVVFDPVQPDSLYFGIFQTTDGGRNWVAINEGLPGGVQVQVLAIDPRSGSTLYAGVASNLPDPVQGVIYKRQIGGIPPVGVMGTVESPEDGQPVSGIGFLRGWVFSTRPGVPQASVFVIRDDLFDTESEYSCCSLRYDVQAAFPQFPPEHTLNSGWGTMINWGTLSTGPHRLQASFFSEKGDSHYPDPRTVTVIKPGDFEFLDQFALSGAQASIIGDELVVRGVVVQDVFTKQQKRIDVRYRWFTNQQSLGLVSSETVATLSSVQSKLTSLVAAVARWLWQAPNLLPSAQAAQNIFSNFESPDEGQVASGIGILRGWSFAEEPPPRWSLYRIPSARPTHLVVDGKIFDRITCCADREDVAVAFPDKIHAIISGWAMQLNYGEFDPGEHILSVEINPGSPTSQILTRRITTIRIGGFRFLDQFNLTGATARIEGEEIVLSGVLVRDKASQQTKVIDVRLRWFQHSQSLGIVASS